MSKTYRCYDSRESTMKREGRYCGYEGETSGPKGRKLNKQRTHRDARQAGKRQLSELL